MYIHPARSVPVPMPPTERRALWPQTTRHTHYIYSNVIWPCNTNRNEHAGENNIQASTPDYAVCVVFSKTAQEGNDNVKDKQENNRRQRETGCYKKKKK